MTAALAAVRHRLGVAGPVIVLVVVGIAVFGPLLAPHSPTASIGIPGDGPSGQALLGLDQVGRDVLSRTLHGGRTALGLGALTTVLAYLAATAIGLTAGFARSWLDPLLMRAVDVLVVFPPLIVLLVLVTGLGSGVPVLVLGVAIVLVPGMSRIVRTATLEVVARGYVEAAVARGERPWTIVRREVLPNIVEAMLATLGLRFAYAIILIASVNFLGLGLRPPTPDWGLMASENRQVIDLNPYAVLAPGLMLGLLTIGVTLVADAYARGLGRSARKVIG
ncbi:ABC transporter permease [Pseudonocardia acaciae]|uniref:ABC transporter permease n=1 Tax=Pseudonocardia acaciae TaxID=551276 RepID=UPI00055A6798|nr:ABC transporter permease [Pseudonocardia acaciae]